MSQEMSEHNVQSDSSMEAMKVTLLGDGWTSSTGGLATLNRELAIQLSQYPQVEVCLLVPDGHCTDEDKSEAKEHGITVVSAKKRPGYDEPLDWLIAPPKGHKMNVVVGHGANLGRQVQFIKDSARFDNCKWVQVVHTAPEDLSKYKDYSDRISKGEKKHEVEVELCKLADLIVPIGPRLEEVYSSCLQRYKKDVYIFPVTPGLFAREFGELEQSPNENAEFKVLLCGRADEEDFELKGYNLAAKAFTDDRLKRKRYSLLFVGAPEGKQEVVRERFLQCGIAQEQLTVRTFVKSREKMKDLLCEVDLAIMPSKAEGFGLVALEALSAGLPILVNSKSGFARALEELPFGELFIVNSAEPAKWAEAIEGVRNHHRKRLKDISLLRTSYHKQYSWMEQCGKLVEKLWTMVYGSSTGSVKIPIADPPVQEQSAAAAAAPDKGLSGQQPSFDEEKKVFGVNEEDETSGVQSRSLQKERKQKVPRSTFDLGLQLANMSNQQKGKQRPRNKGDPSWYDTSLTASANPEEEVMEIPRDKVGLVIGRQGQRVREIREQSGAQISIKDNKAHLRGTAEQREKARKIIEEVLNPNAIGEGNRVGFKKLQNLLIPERLISRVIGKGREKLNNIGVTLKVINNEFYIRASTEEKEKLAVREIREIASLWIRRFRTKVRFTRFVYVDSGQLEDNHEFQLTSVPLPLANSKEPCYKLELLEHPLNEETVAGFTDVENLREKILEVLKQIHKEKGEDEVKVDMWCHLGHAYITDVDEDELGETFTLKEIIQKTESADSNSWGTFFKGGVEKMELQYITALPSQSTKEDIRQDFTFYTPSCRNVRVKAWLIEHDDGEQGTTESQSNMAFSASAPVPVKNALSQVLCNEGGDTSSAPCFHICSPFHHQMKVHILMPGKGLDCRLSIRTCKIGGCRSPEDDEEDKILKSYLMGMKIDKNELTLPPTSQLQDGFDLHYQRRSLRQTYQYERDGEHFSLTVCKEQARNVDPCNMGTISIDDIPAKTDIHLHCDEWDRVLDEGNWEPEEIVAKLPAFLQFLRSVQRNVAPI